MKQGTSYKENGKKLRKNGEKWRKVNVFFVHQPATTSKTLNIYVHINLVIYTLCGYNMVDLEIVLLVVELTQLTVIWRAVASHWFTIDFFRNTI